RRPHGGEQPFEQREVEGRERMAAVHHDDDRGKRRPRGNVRTDQMLPMPAYLEGNSRITVAGQVDEVRAIAECEEVDELRAPGRLAYEREPPASRERVDRARLAGVG